MAREPQRREQPAPLDARLVPFERALRARAEAIEESRVPDGPIDAYTTQTLIAAEFRALAAELRHW